MTMTALLLLESHNSGGRKSEGACGKVLLVTSMSSPPPKSVLPPRVRALLNQDAELARAVGEVDRSLVELAMMRTLGERLRAGVAMARLGARFRR